MVLNFFFDGLLGDIEDYLLNLGDIKSSLFDPFFSKFGLMPFYEILLDDGCDYKTDYDNNVPYD